MTLRQPVAQLSALIGFLLAVAVSAIASDKPEHRVTVLTAGPVEVALCERVTTWVSENIAPAASAQVLKARKPLSVASVLAQATKQSKDEGIATLVLVSGIENHVEPYALVSNKVVVIDIDMLKSGADSTPNALETFYRRVEKESVGGLAYALGVPPCVLPSCALTPTSSMQELDLKGRNLCPPCQGKLQALLEEQK